MARVRREDDEGSLDSLLDTLTNVVGILLIVLVVTQLGVADAVKRIGESAQVDPAKIEAAKADADQLHAQKQALEEQLAEWNDDPQARNEQMARLQKQISDAEAKLKALALERKNQAEQARRAREAAERQLAEQRKQQAAVEQQAQAARAELAQLQTQLSATPRRDAPPAKVVHLPNPRPAPEGAAPVTLFCWQQRVFPVNLEELRERAKKRFAYVVTRYHLDRNPVAGLDAEEVIERFNQEPLRAKYFDLSLTAYKTTPYLKLVPKAELGETREQIIRSNSDYQTLLRQIKAEGNYARFLVFADSFETYLAARQIAEEHEVMAGWQVLPVRNDYRLYMGGGKFRYGPPPKPNPAAKSSAPKKPKPPANEID